MADGDIPEQAERPVEPTMSGPGVDPTVIVVNTRERAPMEFNIRQKDLEKHGFTRACAGCKSMNRGGHDNHIQISSAQGSESC